MRTISLRIAHTLIQFVLCYCLILSVDLRAMACDSCIAVPPISTWQLLDQLKSTLCEDIIISQDDVPYAITEPGVYALCEDLVNVGDVPIITIDSEDVVLNLACHNMEVTQGVIQNAAIRIVSGSPRIYNGKIKTDTSGMTPVPLAIDGSGNIHDIQFTLANNSFGVNLDGTANAYIHDCRFNNGEYAIIIQNDSNRTLIEHCEFISTNSISIFARDGSDTIAIEDCFFYIGSNAIFVEDNRGTTIQNCIFKNVGNDPVNRVITGVNVERMLIRNVTINETGVRVGFVPDIDAIRITGPDTQDVLIVDTVIEQPTGFGIIADAGDQITVCRCIVQHAFLTGIDVSGATEAFVNSCKVVGFAGSTYAGVPAILIATTDADVAAANYWMNIERIIT